MLRLEAALEVVKYLCSRGVSSGTLFVLGRVEVFKLGSELPTVSFVLPVIKIDPSILPDSLDHHSRVIETLSLPMTSS